MVYNFTDRLKEWTSYAGIAAASLGAVLPQLVPADNHWVQAWQAVQMIVGGALFFVPQTAGTTAVENDAWSLLRAFAKGAPPQYADAMKPLLAELASHLAKAEVTAAAPAPTPKPVALQQPQVVYAIPVPQVTAPLVADPAAALNPVG